MGETGFVVGRVGSQGLEVFLKEIGENGQHFQVQQESQSIDGYLSVYHLLEQTPVQNITQYPRVIVSLQEY